MSDPFNTPTLSICIPTHDRPALLDRALRSAMVSGRRSTDYEILVSDNAPDIGEPVVRPLVANWEGRARYLAHRPGLGPVGNFNRCIAEAAGRYVLLLHDDDELLPGGVDAVLDAITATAEPPVLLFGVHVVDERGSIRRRQTFRRLIRLSPSLALVRLLRDSSFVRIPGIVVRRDAFAEVGDFDPAVGRPTDFDLYIRLFSRFGVTCVPQTTANYTVHAQALTDTMFTRETIETMFMIFERAEARGVLAPDRVRRCQADWFHQFILGGAYRRLRVRDWDGAREIMSLFSLPEVAALGRSLRWVPIRSAIGAILLLPNPMAGVAVRVACLLEGIV